LHQVWTFQGHIFGLLIRQGKRTNYKIVGRVKEKFGNGIACRFITS